MTLIRILPEWKMLCYRLLHQSIWRWCFCRRSVPWAHIKQSVWDEGGLLILLACKSAYSYSSFTSAVVFAARAHTQLNVAVRKSGMTNTHVLPHTSTIKHVRWCRPSNRNAHEQKWLIQTSDNFRMSHKLHLGIISPVIAAVSRCNINQKAN